jgi:exosome complex component RRP43
MASVVASSIPGPSLDQTQNLPQEDQDALKAAVFQRLHPRVYLERFVQEAIRPDGRALSEAREVSLNVGACCFERAGAD